MLLTKRHKTGRNREEACFLYKRKRFAARRKRIFFRVTAIFVPVAIVLLLSQTVFAQTTYVITDGNRVLVHTTSATDPETVLGEAGFQLDTDDTYIARSGNGTAQINVRRGQRVYLDYYGQRMEVLSPGETVGELLCRLNLTWGDGDSLSVPPEAETYDGMALTVARRFQEKQTYTAALPYETIRCSDAALPEGTQKVMVEGKAGQLLCEANVTYLNGIETKREILCQQVVAQPVNEIIAVGTREHEAEEGALPRPVIDSSTITLSSGEVLTYTEKVTCLATAYTCEGYVGTTATGTRARVGAIAVDPEMFPYGTRFYIETKDGEYIYGVATAEDCGDKRFIYDTRLDLYFNTKQECIRFGARSCNVYILG